MQDGPTPHFLSAALADRILGGDLRNAGEAQLADGIALTGMLSVSSCLCRDECSGFHVKHSS